MSKDDTPKKPVTGNTPDASASSGSRVVNARRKLILAAAGSAVAHKVVANGWQNPSVDFITLPAHAATTVADVAATGAVTVELLADSESAPDWILLQAHAGEPDDDGATQMDTICVEVVGSVVNAWVGMYIFPYREPKSDAEIDELPTPEEIICEEAFVSNVPQLSDFFATEALAGDSQDGPPPPYCFNYFGDFTVCVTGRGEMGNWVNLGPHEGQMPQIRVTNITGKAPNRKVHLDYRRLVGVGMGIESEFSRSTVIDEQPGECSCNVVGGKRASNS